ncbi:LexA family protein [Morganella morganii]|uniref:LexA family protein n=1 Tax=Morganella morganii TaxID=582 RepID=UPI003B8A2253|nr:helix-turn-helix domain-containing protein [Morganella morganii]
MKIDDNFKTRITLARQSMGLTQGELAEKIGVVRRQVAAYEAGDSKPREKVLSNLAAALGASPEWLSHGHGPSPDLSNVRKTVTLIEIPVISLVNSYDYFFGKSTGDVGNAIVDFIPAPLGSKTDSFAVEIAGDAMTSSRGLSFPSGTVVVFNPTDQAKIGDFVLCALHPDKALTFKQFISSRSEALLRPLNALYRSMPLNDDTDIIGVAIHSQYDLTAKRPFWDSYPDNDFNPELFPNDLWMDYEKETPRRGSSVLSRLDKIESMLENLLKNK